MSLTKPPNKLFYNLANQKAWILFKAVVAQKLNLHFSPFFSVDLRFHGFCVRLAQVNNLKAL